MKKRLTKLLRDDLMKHYFIGDCIGTITTLFCFIWFPLLVSLWIGLLVVLIVAIIGELIDSQDKNNHFSLLDLFFTVLPQLRVLLIAIFILKITL